MTSSWASQRVTIRTSKSAAATSPAGRSSASPSPAPCLRIPVSSILDDSTSSVDVETETKIQDALARQEFNHTSLVVAQRISTVLRADKIIVLDAGRIAAQGTHQELIASSPIYREIYESQLGNGFKPEDLALVDEVQVQQ